MSNIKETCEFVPSLKLTKIEVKLAIQIYMNLMQIKGLTGCTELREKNDMWFRQKP